MFYQTHEGESVHDKRKRKEAEAAEAAEEFRVTETEFLPSEDDVEEEKWIAVAAQEKAKIAAAVQAQRQSLLDKKMAGGRKAETNKRDQLLKTQQSLAKQLLSDLTVERRETLLKKMQRVQRVLAELEK
jgi:hypothetical protein